MKQGDVAMILYTKKDAKSQVYEAALHELAKTSPVAQEALATADRIMNIEIRKDDTASSVCTRIYQAAADFATEHQD